MNYPSKISKGCVVCIAAYDDNGDAMFLSEMPLHADLNTRKIQHIKSEKCACCDTIVHRFDWSNAWIEGNTKRLYLEYSEH